VRRSCRFKATKTDKNRKFVSLLREKNQFLSVFAFKPKKAEIATKANSDKRQKVTKAIRKNRKSEKSQIFTAKLAKNVRKRKCANKCVHVDVPSCKCTLCA